MGAQTGPQLLPTVTSFVRKVIAAIEEVQNNGPESGHLDEALK